MVELVGYLWEEHEAGRNESPQDAANVQYVIAQKPLRCED